MVFEPPQEPSSQLKPVEPQRRIYPNPVAGGKLDLGGVERGRVNLPTDHGKLSRCNPAPLEIGK